MQRVKSARYRTFVFSLTQKLAKLSLFFSNDMENLSTRLLFFYSQEYSELCHKPSHNAFFQQKYFHRGLWRFSLIKILSSDSVDSSSSFFYSFFFLLTSAAAVALDPMTVVKFFTLSTSKALVINPTSKVQLRHWQSSRKTRFSHYIIKYLDEAFGFSFG